MSKFKLFSIKSLFKDGSLTKDTIKTTVWASIGKSVGFLVPFFLARWFGVSSETDAFYFAYGLVLFLCEIFSPVLESIIVPYIANLEQKNKNIGEFIGKILSVYGIGLTILMLLLIPFIRPLLSIVTNFSHETLNLAHVLVLEMIPLLIIMTWNSILSGSINAYKKFMIPALSPGFRAIINLIVIFSLKNILGVHTIAIGYIIGELFRMGFLMFTIYKTKIFLLSFSFKLDFDVKDFFKTSFYQTLGMVVVALNPFVDKTMATWLETGSVSIIYYADRLFMIPMSFIVSGLMVTLLSHWSWRFSQTDYRDKIYNDVSKAIKVVIVVCLPILLILIIFSKQIVAILFGKNLELSEQILNNVNITWLFYLVGFIPAMIGRVFGRAHLSFKNTIILMQGGFLSFAMNILLNLILIRFMGVAGLALSTSVVYVITLFFYRWAFYRKLRGM